MNRSLGPLDLSVNLKPRDPAWDAGQPERDRKHWARVRAGLAADVGNPATALFNKFAAEDAAKRALAGISEQILEVV